MLQPTIVNGSVRSGNQRRRGQKRSIDEPNPFDLPPPAGQKDVRVYFKLRRHLQGDPGLEPQRIENQSAWAGAVLHLPLAESSTAATTVAPNHDVQTAAARTPIEDPDVALGRRLWTRILESDTPEPASGDEGHLVLPAAARVEPSPLHQIAVEESSDTVL